MTTTIKIAQEVLDRGLSRIVGVIGKNPILPVLDMVEIRTDGDGAIILTTTNLEVSAQVRLPALVVGPEVTALVPAETLAKLVKEAPSQPLVLQIRELDVKLTTTRGRYTLPRCTEDYPDIPNYEGMPEAALVMKPKRFAEMLDRARYAVSTDELRGAMCGVMLRVDKSLNADMTATDAHRLVRITRTEDGATIGPALHEAILPGAPLKLVSKFLEPSITVCVSRSGSNIFIEQDDDAFIIRLIDGMYPAVDQIIPKDAPIELRVDRALLESSLDRLMVVAQKTTNRVVLVARPESYDLLLDARDDDFSRSGQEKVALDYAAGLNKNFVIAINGKYLAEMLSTVPKDHDQITIELTAPSRAMILRSHTAGEVPDNLHLMMPIMLPDGTVEIEDEIEYETA